MWSADMRISSGGAALGRKSWEAFAGPFGGEDGAGDAGEDGEGNPEETPTVIAGVHVTACGLVDELNRGDE